MFDLIRENKKISWFIAIVTIAVITIIAFDQNKEALQENNTNNQQIEMATIEEDDLESFFKRSTTSPTLVYDPIENKNEPLLDAVVKTYLAQILSMEASAANDPEVRAFFAQEVVAEARQFIQIQPKYNTSSMTTFAPQDASQIKKYGNDFSEIILYYGNIFDTIPNVDNPDRYVPLVTKTFLLFADDITKIQVPVDIAEQHVELANNLYKLGVLLERMLHIADNDPLQEYFSLQEYEKLQTQQDTLFKAVADYLKRNDILFETNEYGAFWYNL